MRFIFVMLSVALVCMGGALCAQAQTTARDEAVPRYEVGGHLQGFGGYSDNDISSGGVGGRFTYNLTQHLALDTQLDVPLTFNGDDTRIIASGVQGFAGLKAGWRYKRIGLFAKARPGFTTDFHRAAPAGRAFLDGERLVKPAFDVGGVFEYYITRRAAIRYDAGVMIIPFGGEEIAEVSCPCPRRLGTVTAFASSLGFTVRF